MEPPEVRGQDDPAKWMVGSSRLARTIDHDQHLHKMSSAQRDMFNMDQMQIGDQLLAQGSALASGSLTTMDAWKEATGFTGGTFEQAKELFGRMTREQQRKAVGSMIRAAEDKTVVDPGKWAALVNSVKPME